MSKISDILQDDESLEKENPLLHSISKENPFSVPVNYFDSLPSEIIEKCREKVEPKTWGNGILTNILGYKWRLLTTMGCLAVICYLSIQLNNRPVSYEAIAKNIPDSLIVEHFDKNITDINVSILEDFQEPESISSPVKSSSDTNNNTDQAIIAYLINHNISVSDIENEP
jgi:hypothetical protein